MEQQLPHDEEQTVYNLPQMHITEGLLQQQIDTTQILEEVENTLLGRKQEFDTKTGNLVWKKGSHDIRLINEKGMAHLLVQLKSRITKIFQLSYFEDYMIEGLFKSFGRSIRHSIFQHWDEWGIKSNADATAIAGILDDTYLATLQKAHKGKYLQYLANVFKGEERATQFPAAAMHQAGIQEPNTGDMLKRFFRGGR